MLYFFFQFTCTAIDLEGQIQQSLISAESALQQMRTESMTGM